MIPDALLLAFSICIFGWAITAQIRLGRLEDALVSGGEE